MSQVSSNRVLRELDNRKDLPPAGHRSATAPAALQQSAVKMTTDDKWKFSPFHIFRKLIGGSTGVGHHQPSTKKDSSNQAPLRQQTAEQAAAALLRQQHQQEQNATARSLIFHMVVRAKADELATTQGNRGVDKLKLINVLWKRIESDPMLREALLRNGLLRGECFLMKNFLLRLFLLSLISAKGGNSRAIAPMRSEIFPTQRQRRRYVGDVRGSPPEKRML